MAGGSLHDRLFGCRKALSLSSSQRWLIACQTAEAGPIGGGRWARHFGRGWGGDWGVERSVLFWANLGMDNGYCTGFSLVLLSSQRTA